MIAKGYQRKELPGCPNITEARENGTGPLNADKRVKITGKTCVIGDQQGRIVFYDQPEES